MKKGLLNLLLFTISIAIIIGLFLMKQRVVEYEKQLNNLTKTIQENMREIHTLKADWAVLTEPSRLRHLIAESSVKNIKIEQVISPDEVELTPIPVPPPKPFQEEDSEQSIIDGDATDVP